MTEHTARRIDYEYRRNGTRNIFCAVEPKGGRRRIAVTKRRTKQDFATFVCDLVETDHAGASKIHIVCDNLNTHFPPSFYETFGKEEADRILSRIEFHYTPKHASGWIGIECCHDEIYCCRSGSNPRYYWHFLLSFRLQILRNCYL